MMQVATAFVSDYKGKRLQAVLEVISDTFVVSDPKLLDRDLNFRFTAPEGYQASESMTEGTPDEWIVRIEEAGVAGQLRGELVEKAITSIRRLPELEHRQRVGICYSGGKDSAVIAMIARMRYPRERIFAMFADTKDEWPETYEHIPLFARWAGLDDLRILESIGIHTVLREKIPCWPIMRRRHCTKNVKMLPIRDHLDENGFDQVRKDRKPARFRPTHERAGAEIDVREPSPLLIGGERHMESIGRCDISIEPERDELLMRVTARPVIDWSIEDIWDFTFWMRAPWNPVYQWIKRVACAGCPFASDEELYTLGEHHPNKLREWAETEKIIGVPRLGGVAFNTVLNNLEGGGRFDYTR